MATAQSLAAHGTQNAWDNIGASATDSVLVAAQTGKKIRVLAFTVNQGSTTASTVQFNSKGSGAGTAIYPVLLYSANGGTNSPLAPTGLFETNAGEALTVSTGAGSTTGVAVVYEYQPVAGT